jgi:hypothetical protein
MPWRKATCVGTGERICVYSDQALFCIYIREDLNLGQIMFLVLGSVASSASSICMYIRFSPAWLCCVRADREYLPP